MTRRLVVLLLSTALALAAVVAGPCTSGGACAMAQARMHCCDGVNAGISAPRCCTGPQQVSRSAIPATAERPLQSWMAPAAFSVVAIAVLRTIPGSALQPRGFPTGTAPPGGTLIAQHTSLLL